MLQHLYWNSDSESPYICARAHGASPTMAKDRAPQDPAKEQPSIPQAPSPIGEPASSPEVPPTGKVVKFACDLIKHTIKGSHARVVLQALMGDVDTARDVLKWDDEDLTVLLPTAGALTNIQQQLQQILARGVATSKRRRSLTPVPRISSEPSRDTSPSPSAVSPGAVLGAGGSTELDKDQRIRQLEEALAARVGRKRVPDYLNLLFLLATKMTLWRTSYLSLKTT
eukprot:1161814-Pelagomonas_calceolata.AAC.13